MHSNRNKERGLKQDGRRSGKGRKGGRELYRICKTPQKAMKLHNMTKAMSAVLTQMRTGKIGLRNYLHRIGQAESSSCPCGSEDQTVKHVLLTCQRFAELRLKTWGNKQPLDLREMLNNVEHARKAAEFMLWTKLLGQFIPISLQTAHERARGGE